MPRGALATAALVVLATVAAGSAERVLAVFPLPSRSHKQLYSPLVEELARRGHQVTVVSPFADDPGDPGASNVTDVRVVFNITRGGSRLSLLSHPNMFARMFYMFASVTALTDMALASPDVAQLIRSRDEHFDLVIALTAVNDALLAFGRRFDAPVIGVCTTLGIPWAEHLLGNELPASYVPNTFHGFGDRMTFAERLENCVFSWWGRLLHRLYVAPAQDAAMRRHFPGVELSPLLDLYRDVALYFVNIVPGVNYPRPLPPNMVPVGGLQILPARPLPQDIKNFLDEAKEGAILFSLGTNLRSADLSQEKREVILKVFSKLKQRVLWKFETDFEDGLPGNVKIWKWLPQSDVLAHRNLKVFVTHGGLLSGQEAVYHGVPVLAIPFLADQQLNAAQAQRSGLGIALQLASVSEASLGGALRQLLHDPSYREKAQQASRIFRDQPQSALERAVFWSEYVMRHKGAPHLRPAAADLAWFQRYLLDVVAVLALAAASVTYCVLLACRRLFCAFNRTNVGDAKKKL